MGYGGMKCWSYSTAGSGQLAADSKKILPPIKSCCLLLVASCQLHFLQYSLSIVLFVHLVVKKYPYVWKVYIFRLDAQSGEIKLTGAHKPEVRYGQNSLSSS